MQDCGEGRGYLTLYRIARWQPHLYPVTSQCYAKGRVALALRKRPTENTNDKVSATPINRETVTFYEDKPTRNAGIPVTITKLEDLPKSLQEDRVHSLIDIMKRPLLMGEFNWATTDVSNAVLFTANNPNTLLINSMIAQKITGFVGFKAKMIVRLQVNAQRFMQGRLMVTYVPLMDSMGGTRTNLILSNLIFKSQLQRIDYDVSTDTDVILEVPFIYPYEYFPLRNKSPTIGVFNVSVYSPLVTTIGSTTAGCTVWGYFDDVELVYPTVLLPQIFDAQMARVKKGRGTIEDVSSAELASVGLGPVSAVFSKVSRASTVLSQIPLLSSIAMPVSWVSGVLSQAASALGFSNPTLTAPITRVLPVRTAGMNSCVGTDNSQSFGLMRDNQVQLLPGLGGTDLDEMSIAHLVSIPSYINRFSWSTTGIVGTLLWSDTVGPTRLGQYFTGSTGAGTATVFLPSPTAYISNFFNYWRGSICYTLKVIKTEFHTGRLLVAWIPDNSVAPLFSALDPVYKEVLDLRGSNEFSICIPYASISPWKKYSEVTGVIGVYVLNPLVSANAATAVDILIEVNGGPDYEVAFPTSPPSVPVIGNYTAQMYTGDFKRYDNMIWDAQILGPAVVSDSSNSISCSPPDCIASATLDAGGISSSTYCIGEKVLSLRQLMKRSTPWWVEPGPYLSRIIKPFAHSIGLWLVGSPITYSHMPDYWDSFGALFALNRGGIRLKGWDTSDIVSLWSSRLNWDPTRNVVVDLSASTSYTAMADVVCAKTSMTGALEIEVPMYSQLHTRVVTLVYDGAALAVGSQYDQSALEVRVQPYAGSSLIWYRQAAEDVQFGCFVGVMPLLPSTAYSGTTPNGW